MAFQLLRFVQISTFTPTGYAIKMLRRVWTTLRPPINDMALMGKCCNKIPSIANDFNSEWKTVKGEK